MTPRAPGAHTVGMMELLAALAFGLSAGEAGWYAMWIDGWHRPTGPADSGQFDIS